MHFKFFAYNDRIVLLFSGNICPYGSRASQILELGVSEFCSNLLVIQHLETMFVGGNHVRVVCERVNSRRAS